MPAAPAAVRKRHRSDASTRPRKPRRRPVDLPRDDDDDDDDDDAVVFGRPAAGAPAQTVRDSEAEAWEIFDRHRAPVEAALAAAAAAPSSVQAAAATAPVVVDTDPVTQRDRKRRRKRQQAAAAACGDAIQINADEHRVPRQRAEERHRSDSHPAWDLQAALAACSPIPPNPHVEMREPVISNVVATARCRACVPDMQRLVWLFLGRRSHGEFARPVTAALWPEGSTIAIQTSTGIINQTGQKSSSAAVIAILAYMEAVATHLHIPLTMTSFEVFNMHATFRVGGYIDLRALHAAVEHSIYNPDLIQCVTICIKDPRATVNVWATGAVVVNGCKTREQHMRVYNEFGHFLSQFVRAGSGTTVRATARGRGVQRSAAAAAAPAAAAAADADDDGDDDEGDGADADEGALGMAAPLQPRVTLRRALWWDS